MLSKQTSSLNTEIPLVLLDTHIAIWMTQGNPRLKKREALLQAAYEQEKLFLSAISAWEIGMLATKGRIDLPASPQQWFAEFVSKFSIQVIDVTADIALHSSFMLNKIHGDPADRIIVATCHKHDALLLTADKQILSWSKGLIDTLSI
jgi:PIN domain nuclease of toxin-antitoxin system